MKKNVFSSPIALESLSGPIDEVIAKLQSMREEGITEIKYIDGFYDSWPELEALRQETDEEYAKRLEVEEKIKWNKEQEKLKRERRQKNLYEKLKAKYEPEQATTIEK